MNKEYIAHRREIDGEEQGLETHLIEVGKIAGQLASKLGVSNAGELLGLLHDFGKYSHQFQTYIKSATGLINPDEDDYVDAKGLKGKVDHSSAGAQWVWNELHSYGPQGALCAQILALCIASHHSGLIDCLKPEGGDNFTKRISKEDNRTHLQECIKSAHPEILSSIHSVASRTMLQAMCGQLQQLGFDQQNDGQKLSTTIRHFNLGFWTRFLFSCLIDADRINSADFENPENKQHRRQSAVKWQTAIERTETYLTALPVKYEIDKVRRNISDACKKKATQPTGIYSLTVPTGGGKTFASLRYALHHANAHKLERIFYVIPYTSIIDQNAAAIKDIVESESDSTPWVLEHHSNLEPEQQTWHSKLVAENWDAPIVLTTMVQFLETLFSGGTRGVRRMHQLANSVIIFDEIQTLPINCTHLFCNALNFLSAYTNTTAVLCTATQPLLNELRSTEKGQLSLPKENELVGDAVNVALLFQQLERVNINNRVRANGWSEAEIADLALTELQKTGSCLVIVNTKAWAQALYEICSRTSDADSLFHLSTNQCPAHRKLILDQIRGRLDDGVPVLCISTQLIEAGVDVDFDCVIRFLAGLDSIAQAAGRCNRNGRHHRGEVHVVNPTEESIDLLRDITEGRDKARRVLDETNGNDMLSPAVMRRYFDYYFFARADEMSYSVTEKIAARTDTLLNLLSNNDKNITKSEPLQLRQSFMAAGKAFKAIDAPTEALIVPYREGKEIISELCAVAKDFNPGEYYRLLKKAQKYSVNIFPNVRQKLVEQDAIYEIQGEGIYYLDSQYYSAAFGVSTEAVNKLEFMSF